MRELFSSLFRIFKRNAVSVLTFELMYRTATFLITGYCVQIAIDFSLKTQKFSYLTAENYIHFISHPLSVALTAAILCQILFFFLIESAALITCFEASARGQKVTTGDLLLAGVYRALSLVKRNRLGWILAVLISVPVMAFQFIVREVSYVKLLQFTAQQLYKSVEWHWLLFAAGVSVLVLSMAFLYTLPWCLLGGQSVIEGLKSGFHTFLNSAGTTILGIFAGNLLAAVIVGAVYLLVMAGVVIYAMTTRSPSMVAGAVLTYSRWVDIGIGLVAGAAELIITLGFMVGMFGRAHPQAVISWEKRPPFRKKKRRGMKFRRRVAAVLTAILLCAEGGYAVYVLSQNRQSAENIWNTIAITAHRGGALMAPENTISALSYANDTLSDYAEIDVQETKDKVLVLLHDNSLKRTAGLKENIWDVGYAQLSKLDAGISFHKKFRGERVPTLEEAINFSKGKLDLNIEIKYNGENKGIARKVVREIEKNDFVEHCVITSMNYDFLKQVKKANPDIRTGYIMTMTYGSIANVKYADFFSVKHTYIDEDFVAEAHACGKEVHAWTVNYRGDVKQMMNYGVDNIITDNPVLVRKVLDGESDTKSGFLEWMKYALRI